MNVVIAILGLAFLILIHEAGHFFVSLAVGMRPRKFYVGFPPALVKRKHKGIEYAIGAIPLALWLADASGSVQYPVLAVIFLLGLGLWTIVIRAERGAAGHGDDDLMQT